MSESDWCTCQLRCLFFTYRTSTPISESDDKTFPFQRFARSEGEILYSRTTEKIKPGPYGRLHDTARQLYDFFFRQGVNLLTAACDRFGENDLRLTLFFTSHAAEFLLQALHGAYYASESKARSCRNYSDRHAPFLQNYPCCSTRIHRMPAGFSPGSKNSDNRPFHPAPAIVRRMKPQTTSTG